MKKTRFLLLMFFLATGVRAQKTIQNPLSGNLSVQDTGTCSTTNSFLWQQLNINAGTTTVNLSGSFSGTLTVRESNNGGNSWTTAGTITVAGTTGYTTNGFTDFCVDLTTLTSGVAQVSISTGLGATGGVANVTTAPSGSCTTGATPQQVTSTGVLYTCQNGTWATVGGNGVGSPAVGPVINVTNPAYAGCSASALLDYSTCFASVASAANAAAYASVGTPTIRNANTATVTSGTSVGVTVNETKGDTMFIFIVNSNSRTFTFSGDSNNYALVNPTNGPLGGNCSVGCNYQIYATGIGGVQANFSGTLTVTDSGAAEQISVIAIDAFNVGGIGVRNYGNSGTSVTPSVNFPTIDNNNIVLSGIAWFFNGATTVSAATGTLQASIPGTSSQYGAAVVTNTAASPGTVTTSATISSSSQWSVTTLELRSVQITQPTVCLPAGTYNYKSGLNFLQPVTLTSCGDAYTPILCYQGTAHAVDMGTPGLTGGTGGYEQFYFRVSHLQFICGGSMTAGINFQPYAEYTDVDHNYFYDFGGPGITTLAYATGDFTDLIFDNTFTSDDLILHNFIVGTSDSNDNFRISRNFFGCGTNGRLGISGGQCSTSAAGTAININGVASIIADNEFNFMGVSILLSGGTSGVRIVNNYFEANSNIGVSGTIIQYAGNTGAIVVEGNYLNCESLCPAVIAPSTGTDKMFNWMLGHNFSDNLPLATPVVKMNNLTGQTGNTAWQNTCGVTSGASSAPCPILHTTGANITQWNGDYSGTCTMASGACPAYSFLSTYNAAPKCTASWNSSGTLTGLIKVATTTTQLTITSTVGTDTAVINWACNVDAQ